APPARSVHGDDRGRSGRPRHAVRDRRGLPRGLPEGDRGGAAAVADGGAQGAGGRRPDLCAFAHGVPRSDGGRARLPALLHRRVRDDGASPVSHWRTTITLADVTTFLRKAGDWSGGTIASATLSGSNVTLSGGGTSTTIAASSFRSDVNAWAHCLHPDRYPTVNAVNGTTLPQT